MGQCQKQVMKPGMNFARFRQCKNLALEGSEFCGVHQSKVVIKDEAAERRKTMLYTQMRIAAMKRKAGQR